VNPQAERLVTEGTSLYRRGNVQQASEKYRAALALAPDHPRANFNLGVILHDTRLTAEAILHFRRALESQPDWPAALVNLGNALKDQGDLDAALVLYNRALQVDSTDLPALHNLGSIAFLRKDYQEAERRYRVAFDLGSEEARLGLANALRELDRIDEALKLYEESLSRSPESADIYYEFACALEKAKQPAAAARCYAQAARRFAQAVERRPDHVVAMHKLAAVLMSLGDPESAEPVYRRIVELVPEDWIALNNLAKIAIDSGDDAKGRTILEGILESNPDFALAAWNMAHVELRAQRLEQAWVAYETRFRVTALDISLAPDLPVLGSVEEARGKRLGVRAEQGLGDQVLFTTLLPELLAHEIELVVELDGKLLPPYKRCFPTIHWIEKVPAQYPAFVGCDAQIALGSLPGRFRPTQESFNRQPASLLWADPDLRAAFAQQIDDTEIKVGISWRSLQPPSRRGLSEQKSIPLEKFSMLPGQLIDLQYGDVSRERAAFDDWYPGQRIELDGLDPTNDIEGLLAAIDLCDVVVTCCNVTAHLAGALGKKTFVVYLRGYPPVAFWTARRDGRSLWYPSVEIASNPNWTRWETAFEWLATRLRAEVHE
jgi:tetratricopeptide (TPR) repeat protein